MGWNVVLRTRTEPKPLILLEQRFSIAFIHHQKHTGSSMTLPDCSLPKVKLTCAYSFSTYSNTDSYTSEKKKRWVFLIPHKGLPVLYVEVFDTFELELYA